MSRWGQAPVAELVQGESELDSKEGFWTAFPALQESLLTMDGRVFGVAEGGFEEGVEGDWKDVVMVDGLLGLRGAEDGVSTAGTVGMAL